MLADIKPARPLALQQEIGGMRLLPIAKARGIRRNVFDDFAVKDNWVKVQCTECGGNSGWYLSECQAIESWNKRGQ